MCFVFYFKQTSHRKKERFERRNSIRMSKSSLGSRSLASVASTGFTDINYRRRIMAQHNKNHSTGTIMSSASYSGTMQGTTQRPSTANANMNPRGVVGSYDSLAKDGLNSTGKPRKPRDKETQNISFLSSIIYIVIWYIMILIFSWRRSPFIIRCIPRVWPSFHKSNGKCSQCFRNPW